ncbi:hypothetical protein L6452_07423 [Arctium lappa]|uniref:Uncharacterized protein n=1 Tax=Arctium lappa TaxID=4217 RepID=A0ACB9EM41_ARCLA|nr:hypothetical protein L6452_07423 [Arctium lappa]
MTEKLLIKTTPNRNPNLKREKKTKKTDFLFTLSAICNIYLANTVSVQLVLHSPPPELPPPPSLYLNTSEFFTI